MYCEKLSATTTENFISVSVSLTELLSSHVGLDCAAILSQLDSKSRSVVEVYSNCGRNIVSTESNFFFRNRI